MYIKSFNIIYNLLLFCFTFYLLFDTFLFSSVYQKVDDNTEMYEKVSLNQSSVIISENSYIDDNITANLTKYRMYDSDIYVVDIDLKQASLLKTAFAKDSYGKNVTEKTSTIAENNNAIVAINGDYYGVQEYGYVLRGGVIYRNKAGSNREDLVIYKDGSFEIINESDVTIETLLENGAMNVLSFGPGLLVDGEIVVSQNDEVDKAMNSNPRTAIGITYDSHYVFVVSDGRTSESEGLSLYELATFMKELGVETGYNLDGGGSSTLYFNGNVINNPTSTGKSSERSVSDIVYIGY